MVIVLIHWRIKPTEQSVQQFTDDWQNKFNIKDKAGLISEFLSRPLPAEQIPFKVNDLSPKENELPYISFVNIGWWKDMETFLDQVGQNFNDDKPLLEYEQYRRTRTILNPELWRIGKFKLTEKEHE